VRTLSMALAATLIGLALLTGTADAAVPSVGHFRYAIDTAAGSADYSQTGARNKVLVLQSYQVPLMQRLKAANPNLKILIYKDLSGMVERDQWGGVSTGVATQDAAAHPEWFLQNTSGQRFTFRYYDWIWAADIGNAGYQHKWADNVLAEMGSKGWDGVFMDDTNPSMEYHYDVARVAKYPTDAAYQAATGSALATIGARFHAAGKLVVPNFGFWKDYPAVIDGWLRHVDGGMNENFVKVGSSGAADTYDRASVWESQLQSIKDAEAQGKLYLGVSHSANDDSAAARYGYATMLLAGAGNASFALHGDYTNENWFPVYDYAIGTPAAAETRDTSGVHRRKFSNGLVLVNPTNAAVSVQFGGAYTGSGLTNATAATLPPHSSLILAKAGGGAPFRSSRARTARRTRVKAKTSRATSPARATRKAQLAARSRARSHRRSQSHRRS
jgi:putative glycosyl hydrolase-like family 15 (GHL15) protein